MLAFEEEGKPENPEKKHKAGMRTNRYDAQEPDFSDPRGRGWGVIEVYMTGGPTYFFGLKIYTLGIFLGQEICHIFF